MTDVGHRKQFNHYPPFIYQMIGTNIQICNHIKTSPFDHWGEGGNILLGGKKTKKLCPELISVKSRLFSKKLCHKQKLKCHESSKK